MIIVSVIIPVYNAEFFLDKTLKSVLAYQENDIEVILVDDGSTDNSGQICDSFAKQDSRVQVIHKANGGPSSARNAGLNMAQGSYVFFLDADDELDINAFARGVEITKTEIYDWIVFDYKIESQKGINRANTDLNGDAEFDRQDEWIFEKIFIDSTWNAVWGKFYNKKVIRENKIRFNEEVVYAEDKQFNIRYFMYFQKGIYFHCPILLYKMNEGSVMHSFKYRRLNDMAALCEAMTEAVEQLRWNKEASLNKMYMSMSDGIRNIIEQAYMMGKKESKEYIKHFLEKPVVVKVCDESWHRDRHYNFVWLWDGAIAHHYCFLVFFCLWIYKVLYKRRWR